MKNENKIEYKETITKLELKKTIFRKHKTLVTYSENMFGFEWTIKVKGRELYDLLQFYIK